MAPKLKEKKVFSERAEDLPQGFSCNYSWRQKQDDKFVLLATTDQLKLGYCWVKSFKRMISAHLYYHGRVDSALEFSTLHFAANIKEKLENGNLKNYNRLPDYLKDEGLVLDEVCKCTQHLKDPIDESACENVKDKETFKIERFVKVENVNETTIIHLLKTRGPIAAEILVDKGFINGTFFEDGKMDGIYFGASKSNTSHIVLLTGYGTEKGVSYFEFQNSYGSHWGDDSGFGRFPRKISLGGTKPSLILTYMYPEVRPAKTLQ